MWSTFQAFHRGEEAYGSTFSIAAGKNTQFGQIVDEPYSALSIFVFSPQFSCDLRLV